MSRQNALGDRSRYLAVETPIHSPNQQHLSPSPPLRSSRHVSTTSTDLEFDRPSFERPLSPLGYGDGKIVSSGAAQGVGVGGVTSVRRNTGRSRRERKRRGTVLPWKKLLWVKQPCKCFFRRDLVVVDKLLQIRTITQMHLPSSTTSNATEQFSHISSGDWLLILP
jgi:hypothetical protein